MRFRMLCFQTWVTLECAFGGRLVGLVLGNYCSCTTSPMLGITGVQEPATSDSQQPTVHISPQLCILWWHTGSLKLATVTGKCYKSRRWVLEELTINHLPAHHSIRGLGLKPPDARPGISPLASLGLPLHRSVTWKLGDPLLFRDPALPLRMPF